MRLSFIIIILSFCISSEIYRAQVIDSNQNPIANANVELMVDDLVFGSVTDNDGFFLISFGDSFDSGNSFLRISHIGYNDYFTKIQMPNNIPLVIKMISSSIDFNRVVVTGTRSERHIKNTPVLTHVIGNNDIINSSYSNVKDILEMAMPNVQMVSSNHGSDRVKVQGLDNKYLSFLIDGDRVSGEFAGNIDFSMIGLSNVDKIEVIEGAMSILYGSGAMGGVVNIITKKNKNPYWVDSNMQYDEPIGISRSINAGFNKDIFNYSFNFQYTDTDGYDLTPNQPFVYDMTLDENNSKIFNHRIILSPNNKNNFEFSFKEYSSRVNKYTYFGGNLIVDGPLNRYKDNYFKFKYHYKISEISNFKVSFINEEYIKYYYYPTYYNSDNPLVLNDEEFVNGLLDRKEINFQYNIKNYKYNRLIGLESYNENYSSFNIYYPNGDMLQESIFDAEDLTENDSKVSLYFYEERNLWSDNIFSFGLRVQNLDDENIVLPSLSYLIEGSNNYSYRISYCKGYRSPSIKERYYNWQDHAGGPAILGNANLNSTENNYFSISLDKRSSINDFSVDFYRNDITNMISTEYVNGDPIDYLEYRNYDRVLINGMNVHYYRKITDKLKLKFVYNLTDASSNSDEILEGISKHSLRLNLNYKALNKLDLVTNVKYAGEKFIFDQEQDFVGNQSIRELSSYFITDFYFVSSFSKMVFKVGLKNIFNYKDSDRFSSEILNNYDPGRRVFFEFGLKFKGTIND